MDEQEPLKRPRNVPAILKRPNPLAAHATSPIQRGGKAARPNIDGLLTDKLAGACRDRSDHVRSLVHVRTEHDHDPVPFTSTESGHPADMACLGRCHAPIKSRRDVPDRRRASQPAAGRSLLSRPDVTDRIQTASVNTALRPRVLLSREAVA